MASQHQYYDLLGVARDATVEEIKKAFKKAALQHHPDKGGDQEKFKECNAAVEVLGDESKRAAYDLQLLRNRSRDGHGTADERASRRASSVQPPAPAPVPSAGERSQSSRPPPKPRESVEVPADPSGLSVREIKDLLTQLGIRFDGCTEKAELLALLKPAQPARGPQTPRQAPPPAGPALAKPLRIKVLSLGSAGVGKSCLIKRYCEGRFVQKYITTIGVDYGVKPCTILGQATKVNFFDTSGGPEFREIREEFFANASGVVLVFDVTDKRSFSDVAKWIEEARDHRCLLSSKDRPSEQGPPFAVLCANKSDQGRRAVGKNEGERLAAEHGLRYFETSAATGDQVSEAFQHLFEKIISHQSEVRKRLNMSGG